MRAWTIGHGTRPAAASRCSNGREFKRSSTSAATQDHDAPHNRGARAGARRARIVYRHAEELGGRLSGEPGEERFACIRQPAFRSYAARMGTDGWQRRSPRSSRACTLRHVRRDAVDEVSPALHRRPARRSSHEALHLSPGRRASSPRRGRGAGRPALSLRRARRLRHSREGERPADVLLALPSYSPSTVVSWLVSPRMKNRGTSRLKTSAAESGASARRRSVRSARISATSSGQDPRRDRAAELRRGVAKRARPALGVVRRRTRPEVRAPRGAAHLLIEPVQPRPRERTRTEPPRVALRRSRAPATA